MEIWVPVFPPYNTSYFVSDKGRVRSTGRIRDVSIIRGKYVPEKRTETWTLQGKILKPINGSCTLIRLYDETGANRCYSLKYVVYNSFMYNVNFNHEFVPAKNIKMKDRNKRNCSLDNLEV